MKRFSIKLKVTIWFTLVLTFIVASVLALLLIIGEKVVFEETQEKLINAVTDSFKEIDYRFGTIDVDDDLDYYNEGVYIAVYNSDGNLLYGRLPSDFDRSLPFSSDRISTVGSGAEAKYIYDLTQDIGKGNAVTVRGVLSAGESEHAFSAIINLAFIIFPILIIIAAIVGYFLTKRAFLPVKRIADAAENINNANDLKKRIGLEEGNDEIYKLAKEFDLMIDRLQESFENEKRFTSDASHELRTPLAVIIAQAENALESESIDDEARNALNVIHGKATEMSSLVSSLLILSRADKGHLKLNKSDVDLSELIDIVAEQAAELSKERSIAVVTDIESGIHINADEAMIIRLLLNLCENGIKYGQENGELKLSLRQENDYAICTVTDNGIGIKPENLPRIFDRFFREDEARTNGCGLGLPLAKYICEAHGGTMNVTSVLGKGSSFEVRLPI